jgi:hypothetical protein
MIPSYLSPDSAPAVHIKTPKWDGTSVHAQILVEPSSGCKPFSVNFFCHVVGVRPNKDVEIIAEVVGLGDNAPELSYKQVTVLMNVMSSILFEFTKLYKSQALSAPVGRRN